jgi:hypothetical protein
MLLLKTAALAVGIDVIGDRRALEPNRGGENVDHCAMQPPGALVAQAGGDGAGVNAGLEQSFVGIDVAHAAQEALIEQQRLDGGAAGL